MSDTVKVSKASIAIAAFSTVVEWYDFTLYLYFATTLSRVFFGAGESSLLITLGTFAIAYLMRPIGAIAFGHIGDRFGRRHTMLLSMALMTIAMFIMALLPSHEVAGSFAGLALLLLRCVMGFAVGGEYTGVVTYLLESAPTHRRGLITSLAAAASEIGALLAVGVSALVVHLTSRPDLDAWGWRIPFFIGTALASVVWIARSVMTETSEFERQRVAGTAPEKPLRYVMTHHWRGVLRSFAISALGSITYYVGITYVPTFLASAGGLPESMSLWLSTIAAIAVIAVTPVVGLLADKLGRKPVFLSLNLLSAVLPITMFWLMTRASPSSSLMGAVLLAAVAGGVSAVGAVATAEQFPGEGRLSGLAIGATAATAVFGGLTPYIAEVLVSLTGWKMAPGAMIAVVALCVFPVMLYAPETRPKRL